jgi:hypothetical protein
VLISQNLGSALLGIDTDTYIQPEVYYITTSLRAGRRPGVSATPAFTLVHLTIEEQMAIRRRCVNSAFSPGLITLFKPRTPIQVGGRQHSIVIARRSRLERACVAHAHLTECTENRAF